MSGARSAMIAGAVALCVAGLGAPSAGGADPAATQPVGGAAASPFLVRTLRVKGGTQPYAVWLPPGYDRSRAWPCVVFLHGSGECGTDGLKPTLQGVGPALLEHPDRWPCVVLFPQKPREDQEWEEREDLVLGVLKAARRAWRLDADRVALAGISQGGHGAWTIGARHPDLWSCLVPVCGYGLARTVAPRVARLPVWAFHGLKDDQVDPRDTQRIVAELTRLDQAAGRPAPRMTLYPDLNHGCWATAFGDSTLAPWILAQRRGR